MNVEEIASENLLREMRLLRLVGCYLTREIIHLIRSESGIILLIEGASRFHHRILEGQAQDDVIRNPITEISQEGHVFSG